jgi:hypothetical protein
LSLYIVALSGKKTASADEDGRFVWNARADIAEPTVLESAHFVKGYILDLTGMQLQTLARVKDVSMKIEGLSYKLLSVHTDRSFIALKDQAQ